MTLTKRKRTVWRATVASGRFALAVAILGTGLYLILSHCGIGKMTSGIVASLLIVVAWLEHGSINFD
jgi:hypothetical protein